MGVIAINGSPRADGNTAELIRKVLKGSEEAGTSTRLFQLGEMKVSPCIACMGCKKTARCVVKDDMLQTYEALETATEPKGLVLGTPIYFDHVSAQLKGWLDRLYCYTYTELGQKMFPKGFKAALVATYEDTPPERYDYVLEWLAGRLEHYHEIEVVARFALSGSSGKSLDQRGDLIDKARQAGRELAGD